MTSVAHYNNVERILPMKSKERIKWTDELHSRFLIAIDRLGVGPFLARPKDILREMRCPGVNVEHVKSHLQQYRLLLRQFDSSSPPTPSFTPIHTARTASYDQYVQQVPCSYGASPAFGYRGETFVHTNPSVPLRPVGPVPSLSAPMAAVYPMPAVPASQESLQATLNRAPFHAFQKPELCKPSADSNMNQQADVAQIVHRLLGQVCASASGCSTQEAQNSGKLAAQKSTGTGAVNENVDPSGCGEVIDTCHLDALATAALQEEEEKQKPAHPLPPAAHIVTKVVQVEGPVTFKPFEFASSPRTVLEPEQPKTPVITLDVPAELATAGSTSALSERTILEQLLRIVQHLRPQLESSARIQQRSYTSLQMQLEKNRAQEQALKEFLAMTCEQLANNNATKTQ